MTHIAIQEHLDGKVVEWMGKGKRRAIPSLIVEGENENEESTQRTEQACGEAVGR